MGAIRGRRFCEEPWVKVVCAQGAVNCVELSCFLRCGELAEDRARVLYMPKTH